MKPEAAILEGYADALLRRRSLSAAEQAMIDFHLDEADEAGAPSSWGPRRRWMWARLHEKAHDLSAAESAYREAVRGLLAQGSRFHAVSALADLYCMYTRTIDETQLQLLDRQMPVWLEVAELESWEHYQLERLRQKVEECGHEGASRRGRPVHPNRSSRRPRPPNASSKGIGHAHEPAGDHPI